MAGEDGTEAELAEEEENEDLQLPLRMQDVSVPSGVSPTVCVRNHQAIFRELTQVMKGAFLEQWIQMKVQA